MAHTLDMPVLHVIIQHMAIHSQQMRMTQHEMPKGLSGVGVCDPVAISAGGCGV